MSYLEAMRVVLDTNVIVTALRGPRGASAALLRLAAQEKITLLMSVAIALEYEAVCLRPENRTAAGLSEAQIQIFLDGLAALAEPVILRFLWRPQLRDASDEMILEAAVNGGAAAIVTFNLRDFGDAPSRFGIDAIKPQEALRRIGL
jgi:putative PIN family toxin of toxin-antitoxin system